MNNYTVTLWDKQENRFFDVQIEADDDKGMFRALKRDYPISRYAVKTYHRHD